MLTALLKYFDLNNDQYIRAYQSSIEFITCCCVYLFIQASYYQHKFCCLIATLGGYQQNLEGLSPSTVCFAGTVALLPCPTPSLPPLTKESNYHDYDVGSYKQ